MEKITFNLNRYTEEIINKKRISPRGELIQFFIDNLRNKEGKKFSAKTIAIRLAPIKIPDLEYFRSECKDILHRRGQTAMQKYFWYSINPKNSKK